MKRLLLATLVALATTPAWAEIVTEEIEYTADGVTMKGYMAWDGEIEGKRPGVLVVHEWWGHNDYARKRVRQLAELGYTAFALDMYGDGQTADHPEDAGKFAKKVAQDGESRSVRFLAAQEVLESHPTVESGKVAALGYCFGGSVSLNMAREGADLAGVVAYHAGLSSPVEAAPGEVKARVRVFTGAADPMVPPEQVAAFEKEMQAAGVDYEVVSYEGVLHSFTNPDADEFARRFDMPVGYDAAADRDSWEKTQSFLKEIFE